MAGLKLVPVYLTGYLPTECALPCTREELNVYWYMMILSFYWKPHYPTTARPTDKPVTLLGSRNTFFLRKQSCRLSILCFHQEGCSGGRHRELIARARYLRLASIVWGKREGGWGSDGLGRRDVFTFRRVVCRAIQQDSFQPPSSSLQKGSRQHNFCISVRLPHPYTTVEEFQ